MDFVCGMGLGKIAPPQTVHEPENSQHTTIKIKI